MSLQDKTVVELKALARERCLKRYSKPKKADLITLLNPSPSRQILDEPVTGDSRPVLIPTQAPLPVHATKAIKKKLSEWTDWFLDYIPPNPKIVDRVLEAFKQKLQSLYKKEVPIVLKESASALRGFAKQYKIEGQGGYDPEGFLNKVKANVTEVFKSNPSTKVKLILNCIMAKQDIQSGNMMYSPAHFHSYVEVKLEGTDVNDMYNKMTSQIFESIANYNQRGSNWVFKQITSLDIHTVQYEPLGGSSYIELPESLANKNATVNPKNTDNKCFMWSVTRFLHPAKDHPERIDSKLIKASEELNWDGITFPC